MKVKEIVKKCCEMAFCKIEDQYFEDGADITQSEEAVNFLSCVNAALDELYSDYATAVKRDEVRSEDGFIDTTALNLNRVLSLTDGNGLNASYRYTAGGLRVQQDGVFDLVYCVNAPEVGWEDELTLPSPRISPRILCYGVLFEYFFRACEYTTAKQWDRRFTDALRTINVKSSLSVMPCGRWV